LASTKCARDHSRAALNRTFREAVTGATCGAVRAPGIPEFFTNGSAAAFFHVDPPTTETGVVAA